jgi:hypothetical protein
MDTGAPAEAGTCGFRGDGIIRHTLVRIGIILIMTTTTMDGICMKVTGIMKIVAITTMTTMMAITAKITANL